MSDGIQKGLRITLLSVAANSLLAASKLVAGLVGNSYALIADAVESFSDVISSAIVWGGLAMSAKPPDADHPYGHGKAEPLAALAVGLMLTVAAVGIALQAFRALSAPQQAPATFTLIVLAGVVVVKEGLFRLMSRVGGQIGSTAICADAWHHRSDAITSVAAGVGISISVFGGAGYETADEWAALAASLIIVFNGLRFVRQAARELMDVQPQGELLKDVAAAASSVAGVKRVEKILARKMGTAYLCDMHVEVDGSLPVRLAHDLAHQVKDRVCGQVPQVADVLVHVEPYAERPDPPVQRPEQA